jgi:hypothetical protein
MNGWMDGWMYGWMNECMDGWMDEWMDDLNCEVDKTRVLVHILGVGNFHCKLE